MYFPALAIREAKVEINCVKFLLKVEVSAKSLKYLKKMLRPQLIVSKAEWNKLAIYENSVQCMTNNLEMPCYCTYIYFCEH